MVLLKLNGYSGLIMNIKIINKNHGVHFKLTQLSDYSSLQKLKVDYNLVTFGEFILTSALRQFEMHPNHGADSYTNGIFETSAFKSLLRTVMNISDPGLEKADAT